MPLIIIFSVIILILNLLITAGILIGFGNNVIIIALLFVLGFSMLLGIYFILQLFLNPLNSISSALGEAIKTNNYNLKFKVNAESKNEIAILRKRINLILQKLITTTEDLEKRQIEIDQQVKAFTDQKAELERINKHMVGRELRMAELKTRIKELEENYNNTSDKLSDTKFVQNSSRTEPVSTGNSSEISSLISN